MALSFDEHARLVRLFRNGGIPTCPKCNDEFEVLYPGGSLSAVCKHCGLAVRELGSSIGIGAF